MDVEELITMWQANDAKISKAVQLNVTTLDLIISQKVKSSLRSLLWQRIIELTFHSIALVLLFAFLIINISQLPYVISAIALIIFYGFIFINCFKQLQIIAGIENNKTIVSMQQSLMKIQTHLLTFVRLSVLCIPTFLSYPIVVSKAFADMNITAFGNFDLLKKSNGAWWSAEMVAYIILIPLGVWFYKQVSTKNIHKAWVARVITKSSSTRVAKAVEYLNELDELKISAT
ncbi:MAG: hypothetical protein ABJA90_04630 [Ginsengibacter sp.]